MAEPKPAPQPDAQYLIAALMEENRALVDNKLYLIALIKQLTAEINDEREMWHLERASLKAETGE